MKFHAHVLTPHHDALRTVVYRRSDPVLLDEEIACNWSLSVICYKVRLTSMRAIET